MNFGGIVVEWYKKNKRDLPWRRSRDPYLVWISEVILQQTRVKQGLEYYNKFASTFPDVASLAAASEEQVLKLWQGLGYYSRARNMHQAAKELVKNQGGKMPASYEGLLAMKGVGVYTASAVSSICYGEQKAVVDGNVSRVLARYFGVEEAVNSTAGKRIIDQLSGKVMEEGSENGSVQRSFGSSSGDTWAGTHNQAMMEFGALQCVPVSPRCGECPLAASCNARLSDRVEKLPLKIPKRLPLERWMYFYVIVCDGETILTKRGEQGIWRSLYHFPVLESPEEHSEEEMMGGLFKRLLGKLTLSAEEALPGGLPVFSDPSGPIRHQLTHLTIHASFVQVKLDALPSPLPGEYIRIAMSELEQYPVPRLMERYMEVAKF